jgi:hypothetical protein
MPPLTYLFLAYGTSSSVHKQTIASICSLRGVGHSDVPYHVVLYTDHPDYYSWLAIDEIRRIGVERLEAWMGPSRFGFRIKPCMMAEVAKTCEGPLVYVDGDTVFMQSLRSAEERVLAGESAMHLREYQVSDRQTKERRELMTTLTGKDLGQGVMLTEDSWMWNAGLIGLPSSMLGAPADVVEMIDQMIQLGLSSRTRLKEQLAFSLYLDRHSKLFSMDDEVLHYWGNKPEWDGFLDRWLLSVVGQKLDMAEAGQLLLSMQPFPAAVAPKKTKAEKRKAKLRKLLRLD